MFCSRSIFFRVSRLVSNYIDMNYDLASQKAHENLAAVRLPKQQHAAVLRPKPSFQKEKDWPLVRRSQCNDTKEKWRHIKSTRPHIHKTNTTFHFLYRCWKCILKNVVGIKTEAEARVFIAESSSGHSNRKERNANLKTCVERVAENFPGVTSRSERVKLAKDVMHDFFEGETLKTRHET